MSPIDVIIKKLESCDFKVSTDTRKDLAGSVYFALSGENFDGNKFVHEALAKGAIAAVTSDVQNIADKNKNIYLVPNVLKTLQEVAHIYRKQFTIPIIAIGGSNGKTTSKELIRDVLSKKYAVYASQGGLNNHFGLPMALCAMHKKTEIGIFELGANHEHEHTELLTILNPTHVLITNNGMDHLEGFGSPEGVRRANKELFDFARIHKKIAFVNTNHHDLVEDAADLEQITYPDIILQEISASPLSIKYDDVQYTTHLSGNYNIENIQAAICIGKTFGIGTKTALQAVCEYTPLLNRSQILDKNTVDGTIHFIIDCYNANPSSMQLSLDSFMASAPHPRGVIIGDMLELGIYTEDEHLKIVDYIFTQDIEHTIFVGECFKKALGQRLTQCHWFPDASTAQTWFVQQNFNNVTFLIKGSRGIFYYSDFLKWILGKI